ncbi:hypothetical protein Adt_34191 [Abeliophyllum distichum]|uniref:Uncharacterized protein n=1 Tax=Abeliophyllum distichum TaxID=126358 RepID=A0ABD1QYF9_9LAMI
MLLQQSIDMLRYYSFRMFLINVGHLGATSSQSQTHRKSKAPNGGEGEYVIDEEDDKKQKAKANQPSAVLHFCSPPRWNRLLRFCFVLQASDCRWNHLLSSTGDRSKLAFFSSSSRFIGFVPLF